MMSREKLLTLRKKVKAGEALDRDQTLAILDHGIQAYVEMQGGESAVLRRRELAERERQVSIALAQLREVVGRLAETATDSMHPEWGQEALYTVDAILDMLQAKGPTWKREWSWYQPRIEEEFSR